MGIMTIHKSWQCSAAGAPEPVGGPRILQFDHRLTFGRECERHYQELRNHIEQGTRHFIFDLRLAPDMDSAGVGFLVMCLTTVRRAGGELRLAAASSRVLYVLLITRLDTVFPIYGSVGEALQAGLATDPRSRRGAA